MKYSQHEKKRLAYQYGITAEELAADYLEKLGWRILEKNYRVKGAEIDLIALDGAVLVFVEVRARKGDFEPLNTVNFRKLRRIWRGARFYTAAGGPMGTSCEHFDEIRFDFIAVEGERVVKLIRGQLPINAY